MTTSSSSSPSPLSRLGARLAVAKETLLHSEPAAAPIPSAPTSEAFLEPAGRSIFVDGDGKPSTLTKAVSAAVVGGAALGIATDAVSDEAAPPAGESSASAEAVPSAAGVVQLGNLRVTDAVTDEQRETLAPAAGRAFDSLRAMLAASVQRPENAEPLKALLEAAGAVPAPPPGMENVVAPVSLTPAVAEAVAARAGQAGLDLGTEAGIDSFLSQRHLAPETKEDPEAFGRALAKAFGGEDLLYDLPSPLTETQSRSLAFYESLSKDDRALLRSTLRLPAVPTTGPVAVQAAAFGTSVADTALLDATARRFALRGMEIPPSPLASADEARSLVASLGTIGPRPAGEAEKYDWYRLLAELQGHSFRTGPDEKNIFGLRAFDVDGGPHNNPHNAWNDTLAFVWTSPDGGKHVVEFRATTDAGMLGDSRDYNRDGREDVAWISTGQFEYHLGTHQGKPGAGRSVQPLIPVYADVNRSGSIEPFEKDEARAQGYTGAGINIHWGKVQPQVNGWSAGCVVVQMPREEFLRRVTPLIASNPSMPLNIIDTRDVPFAAS